MFLDEFTGATETIAMTKRPTNIAVLGSTGSIGRSTLEVVEASGGSIRVLALAGHTVS